tara:strand:- start:44 stop:592 length:549 start_codon:yes stop_codon:yes gene_type:complete
MILKMFVDTTPFIIALVVTFCFMICVAIWNNINAPPPPQKAPPIEPGPSRTREILARFSEFYMNLNPQGETIFDTGILPDPKQHIVHALYIGFDESEDEDERSAIERGLRAIVTFQERVGDEPIKRKISENEEALSFDLNQERDGEKFTSKLLDDEEFNVFSILRDNELESHFQHLKIESIE